MTKGESEKGAKGKVKRGKKGRGGGEQGKNKHQNSKDVKNKRKLRKSTGWKSASEGKRAPAPMSSSRKPTSTRERRDWEEVDFVRATVRLESSSE